MNIDIHARNLDLDPADEIYIQKKFERIQRHLRNIRGAKIEVSRTDQKRVRARMTLYVSGRILRGQGSGVNLFAAVNAAADVMDRQGRRFKGKVYHSAQARRSGMGFRDIPVEEIADTSLSLSRRRRSKASAKSSAPSSAA